MFNFLRFLYSKRFAELESLVMQPAQYATCVLRMETAPNRNQVVLNDFLSSHLVVAVKIAMGQAKSLELSPNEKANAIKAAEFLLELNGLKTKVKYTNSGNVIRGREDGKPRAEPMPGGGQHVRCEVDRSRRGLGRACPHARM